MTLVLGRCLEEVSTGSGSDLVLRNASGDGMTRSLPLPVLTSSKQRLINQMTNENIRARVFGPRENNSKFFPRGGFPEQFPRIRSNSGVFESAMRSAFRLFYLDPVDFLID